MHCLSNHVSHDFDPRGRRFRRPFLHLNDGASALDFATLKSSKASANANCSSDVGIAGGILRLAAVLESEDGSWSLRRMGTDHFVEFKLPQ